LSRIWYILFFRKWYIKLLGNATMTGAVLMKVS
jgi:hypothetical protein